MDKSCQYEADWKYREKGWGSRGKVEVNLLLTVLYLILKGDLLPMCLSVQDGVNSG